LGVSLRMVDITARRITLRRTCGLGEHIAGLRGFTRCHKIATSPRTKRPRFGVAVASLGTRSK
jgi:hypothetical protein